MKNLGDRSVLGPNAVKGGVYPLYTRIKKNPYRNRWGFCL